MARSRTKGSSPFPFVMGEGKATWDAILADAHTWGGRVTVTRRGSGRRGDRMNAVPSPDSSTLGTRAKWCMACGRQIGVNEVIVPAGGHGASTVWAHKSCTR